MQGRELGMWIWVLKTSGGFALTPRGRAVVDRSMKRIVQIKRSVRKSVRVLPGDGTSSGKPRRVIVTKKVVVARRRTVR
jgi:hypothetical protein